MIGQILAFFVLLAFLGFNMFLFQIAFFTNSEVWWSSGRIKQRLYLVGKHCRQFLSTQISV